ncbi:MAG TPA: class I SAM-dependent methyltransferase family protein [Candidatus Acidoferrales bacterium]|nr:class I SAM-dependent methyltransferase family protein [Candidatus Acidoferrales bacterium]
MKGYDLLERLLGAKLTKYERDLLPRRWQILGDLVLVNIPSAIAHHKREIGDALLEIYPRCKSVLWDKGVQGSLRTPHVEVIAGSGTKTEHKENYCKFALDASRVMFCAGNFSERLRMSKVGSNERVLDMFSGIGQLSIPMAVHAHPQLIVAVELNAIAYGFLRQNVVLNKVRHIVQPLRGDCRDVTPNEQFDRIIMGHFDARDYLSAALRALSPGGVLHYHELTPSELMHKRPGAHIESAAAAGARSVDRLETHKVKDYAPGIAHVVVDATIS